MKRVFLYSFVLSLVLWFTGCGGSNNNGNPTGSTPSITSMTPNKVSRGQTHAEGTILGVNLGGVVSVNLGEGISVEQFSSSGPNQITVRFTVSANASPGARTISVTTNGGTATSGTALTVDSNRAPTAKFTVSPDTGAKNTVFTFDATQSSDPDGTIAAYKWDFGDGKTATGRIATHQFSPGTFQVTLTVLDHSNAASSSAKSVSVVNGVAPVARFTVTPDSGSVDTNFTFDGSSSSDKDGTIVSYGWKFGDGGTATGAVVNHKFSKGGTFNVQLTVTDNDNLPSVLGKDLRVEEFDEQKAKDEITNVVYTFFARYSKLDRLDAEKIVEDWSTDPTCPGRDHEIKIIQAQQQTIAKTTATIVGQVDVFIKTDHLHANANATANFDWTNKDGTTGNGVVEHDFDFVFQDGSWLICNFHTVTVSGASIPQ